MIKHFLKTLIIFSIMIIIGLVGVIVLNYFDRDTAGGRYDMLKNLGIAK